MSKGNGSIVTSLMDQRANILLCHLTASHRDAANKPFLTSIEARSILTKVEGITPSRRDTLRAMNRATKLSSLVSYDSVDGDGWGTKQIILNQEIIFNPLPVETCYVYVIKAEFGFKKIGFSDCPERRLGELLICNPNISNILIKIKCKDRNQAYKLEQALHKSLESYKVNGEWFDISDDLLLIKVFYKISHVLQITPEITLTAS